MTIKGALFLDRDGVINEMVSYPGDESFDSPRKPEDVNLVPGVVSVISWANRKNIPVVEITNQPGVAKGKMDQKTANAVENRVHELLREQGAFIDKVYTCPHHPRGIIPELTKDCDCRKPKPGLLFQAAGEMNIDLSKSVFLGDGAPDAEAGKAAGCKTIIYLHENNLPAKVEEAKNATADYKVDSLKEVIPLLDNIFKST